MKTPWHLWLVGTLSLLWNSVGAFDYTMTMTKNSAYMGHFTPQQMEFFYGFPGWADAGWAVGVWFAVAGSLLLLFRSRGAIWAFALSFIGMAVTSVHNFWLSDISAREVLGLGAIGFSMVIVAVGFLLIWYARAMKMRGVLG